MTTNNEAIMFEFDLNELQMFILRGTGRCKDLQIGQAEMECVAILKNGEEHVISKCITNPVSMNSDELYKEVWLQYAQALAEAEMKDLMRPLCMKSALKVWFNSDKECLDFDDFFVKQWPHKPACPTNEIPRYLVGIDEDNDGCVLPQVIDWTYLRDDELFENIIECGTYISNSEDDLQPCSIKWYIPLDKNGLPDLEEIERLRGLGVKPYEGI